MYGLEAQYQTPAQTPAENKEFELQAPPEGKRPRTPNELDAEQEEEVNYS